jgi:glycosyltransferase involved in cell wall biosynthesis
MAPRRRFVFANSVDYARHTGGWVYNTRVMQELSALGWEVVPLDLPAGFPLPDRAARAQAARLLAALPDDTIVVADQICLSPLYSVAIREAERLRLVMIFHHPIAAERGRPIRTRVLLKHKERAALAACRLVVTTSATTARTVAADYDVAPERIVVASPGIEKFTPSAPPASDTPSLLSVGAVIERKGYHDLIEALAGLRDRPWRLAIVGDLDRAPDYATRLRKQIGAARLADRVILRGGIARADLDACWRDAHIYVAASLHEGYGMAVAEAIARGVPTVTTRAGAVGDWLDPDAAMIVPDSSPEALRDALARVIAEPALRTALRAAALDQASRFPSWADVARKVHERLGQL